MAWYNASWTYRVKVTVLASKVDADITGFPVYVDLSNLPAGFFANVKAAGADIRVTKADGTTEVPREVVFVNTVTNKGELHFKGDVLNNTDVDFYIYYGNSAATEPAANATYGRNNVWTAYAAVWHMQDVNSIVDSTGNGNTGTKGGNVANANGQLSGSAISFPGNSNDRVDVADSNSLDITNAWSITLWFKPATTSQTSKYLLHKYNHLSTDDTYAILYEYSNDKVQFYGGSGATYGYPSTNSDLTVSDTNWHKVAYTYDGTTCRKKLDGDVVGSTTTSASLGSGAGPMKIGSYAATDHNVNAVIDEIRIAGSRLSDEWLSTEYNNQSSASTFYTAGAQETADPTDSGTVTSIGVLSATETVVDVGTVTSIGTPTQVTDWYDPAWTYRLKITILASKVDANLTGFPVYINLADMPATFFSAVKTDGSDIRITKADGITEVPREVVVIDTTAKTGELHFKGDLLDASDVSFFIYYGNAAASEPAVGSTYGRNNVWTAYTNVYHLQSTAGTDSKGTQDGTNSGAAAATGKVAGGLDFQSTDYMDIGQAGTHLDTLTVTAWAKPSALNIDAVIVCKGYDGANTEWQLTIAADNKVFFGTYDGVQKRAVWGSAASSGTWYKFDGKYDGSNYSINVNAGTKVSVANATNPVNTTVKTSIGAVFIPGPSLTQYFQGVIDEVRIAPTALSDAWLSTEYNNQSSPSTFYTVAASDTGFVASTGVVVGAESTVDSGTCTGSSALGADERVSDAGTATGASTVQTVSETLAELPTAVGVGAPAANESLTELTTVVGSSDQSGTETVGTNDVYDSGTAIGSSDQVSTETLLESNEIVGSSDQSVIASTVDAGIAIGASQLSTDEAYAEVATELGTSEQVGTDALCEAPSTIGTSAQTPTETIVESATILGIGDVVGSDSAINAGEVISTSDQTSSEALASVQTDVGIGVLLGSAQIIASDVVSSSTTTDGAFEAIGESTVCSSTGSFVGSEVLVVSTTVVGVGIAIGVPTSSVSGATTSLGIPGSRVEAITERSQLVGIGDLTGDQQAITIGSETSVGTTTSVEALLDYGAIDAIGVPLGDDSVPGSSTAIGIGTLVSTETLIDQGTIVSIGTLTYTSLGTWPSVARGLISLLIEPYGGTSTMTIEPVEFATVALLSPNGSLTIERERDGDLTLASARGTVEVD